MIRSTSKRCHQRAHQTVKGVFLNLVFPDSGLFGQRRLPTGSGFVKGKRENERSKLEKRKTTQYRAFSQKPVSFVDLSKS